MSVLVSWAVLLLEKLYKLGTLFVEKVCEVRSTETKLTGQMLTGKDGWILLWKK